MDIKTAINNRELKITNLDKTLWPDEGYTKSDLISYYSQVCEYILPFLKERPFVMQRFPDGIYGKSFYQKNCPSYAPEWIETFKHKNTNYVLCNNEETLLWLANQSCIEMHVWMSTYQNELYPDYAVFDLDPMPGITFDQVIKTALLVNSAMEEFSIRGYPKTSGAEGIHIFVPVEPIYTYEEIRLFVQFIFNLVNRITPDLTTQERSIDKRSQRIYLDSLQNARGKTMASPYSLRPKEKAPASMFLTWDEIAKGGFTPSDYNIKTVLSKIEQNKDIHLSIPQDKQNLSNVLSLIKS